MNVKTSPWFVSMALAFGLLVFPSLCSFRLAASDPIPDDELIATIFARDIYYRDIKMEDQDVPRICKERGIPYDKSRHAHIRSILEFERLTGIIRREIFARIDPPSDEEISEEAIAEWIKEIKRESFASDPLFTDTEFHEKAMRMVHALDAWQKNPDAFDTLYEEMLSGLYTKEEFREYTQSVTREDVQKVLRITGGKAENYPQYMWEMVDPVGLRIVALADLQDEEMPDPAAIMDAFRKHLSGVTIHSLRPFLFMFMDAHIDRLLLEPDALPPFPDGGVGTHPSTPAGSVDGEPGAGDASSAGSQADPKDALQPPTVSE